MEYYMTNEEIIRFYDIALSSENISEVENKMDEHGYLQIFLYELSKYKYDKQIALFALQSDIEYFLDKNKN